MSALVGEILVQPSSHSDKCKIAPADLVGLVHSNFMTIGAEAKDGVTDILCDTMPEHATWCAGLWSLVVLGMTDKFTEPGQPPKGGAGTSKDHNVEWVGLEVEVLMKSCKVTYSDRWMWWANGGWRCFRCSSTLEAGYELVF